MSNNPILSIVLICLLLLLSVLIFLGTTDMTPGAELFPRIMAGGLALFGVIELIREIIAMRRTKRTAEKMSATTLKSAIYMGAFFLLVIGFFVAFPFIGFEITSVAFMLATMVLLGGKKALRKWPVAILVPALLVLVFRVGLDIRLPSFPLLN